MRSLAVILFVLIVLGFIGCAHPEQGAPGVAGAVGATGPQGPAGQDGSNGRDGANGADGQPARVITLCPGVTVYPSAFVEVALCINNELFGVYSTHGGFLTKFPPGTYSSNTVGTACTLTVQPNCVVVN